MLPALHDGPIRMPEPGAQRGVVLGGIAGECGDDTNGRFVVEPRSHPSPWVLLAIADDEEDERCSASFPHAFPAVLRMTTRTGEELEACVKVNRGGPGHPLSDEELARKFHDNAVRSLAPASVDAA